ncbi:MAG: ATP-binding cassette domain-containing protein [Albidovulum sp.]|nr:ATP-binding cassette domain-containing protein [Albidovulum sp.]
MTGRAAEAPPLLCLRDISMHFGAIKALDNVDLAISEGEVLGLMGDNGAGKSTIVKILAGNLTPTGGSLLVDGKAVIFKGPADARAASIEVVYQDLALCDNLTAAENLFLGREEMLRVAGLPVAVNMRAMSDRATRLFKELESDTLANQLVLTMSGGQRQAVAIARSRLNRSRVVLMDEPTAAISVRQIGQVLTLVERLRDQGVSVLLVSHRMPDVFAVADRIAVLRRGRKVADKAKSDTSPEEVTGLITGALEGAAP